MYGCAKQTLTKINKIEPIKYGEKCEEIHIEIPLVNGLAPFPYNIWQKLNIKWYTLIGEVTDYSVLLESLLDPVDTC